MQHYHLFKKLKSDTWSWFSDEDSELWEKIRQEYDNEKWKQVMELLVNQNMNTGNKGLITKASYKLAMRIKDELGVDVFPAIVRIDYGSMPKMERFSWKMYSIIGDHMRNVYSNWPPKDLLPKKYEIESESFGSLDIELIRSLKSKNEKSKKRWVRKDGDERR
ncbi:hypothetical protein [Paenibacillus medicaginis]|uniref:Uncharacterized protein n=1 Tax=Paenibacillus medicaginis TaxID=1470560 RepID=A0ABV5BUQ0_9BACL